MRDSRSMADAVGYLMWSAVLAGAGLVLTIVGIGGVLAALLIWGWSSALIVFGVALAACASAFTGARSLLTASIRSRVQAEKDTECRCPVCVELRDYWGPDK